MYYVMKLLNLLNDASIVVICGICFALGLFCAVNLLYDPYRKQNKKLRLCTKNIRAYPSRTAFFAASLPADYRRQWRAFVNCGIDKPSVVFEFVPKHKRIIGLWLLIATYVVNALFIAVYVCVQANVAYIVMQGAFWLAFGVILLSERILAHKQIRRAKRIFAEFVTQLAAATPKKPATVVQDTVNALNKLNKAEVTDAAVGKASEILHNKGLTEERTPDEQRRINLALNGLLQSYAKNANRS